MDGVEARNVTPAPGGGYIVPLLSPPPQKNRQAGPALPYARPGILISLSQDSLCYLSHL